LRLVCLDLEGVLVPEVWINVADVTGIDDLRLTTRDIADYDVLMRHRLNVLDRHRLTIDVIQEVIGRLTPLDGAKAFLDGLRRCGPVVILSDTFYEFATPLMRQLDWPTLFCHRLDIEDGGRIAGYRLRMTDHKRAAVAAFRDLRFRTVAAGDSYNDTTMLAEADVGFLFRAPDNVIAEFPQFRAFTGFDDLASAIAGLPGDSGA
jgi:phosphoserine / homoserine phosphotransferase